MGQALKRSGIVGVVGSGAMGAGSAQAVDLALQKGVNYPCGPLAWAGQIGLQHVVAVPANLAATYGEDRYRVSPLLRRKLYAHPEGAHPVAQFYAA